MLIENKLIRITEETETYADTYLGTFKGVNSFPLGDIVAVKGQAKSCKSTFLQIVTASLVGNCRKFGIEPNTSITAVHYLDTEQKIHNTKQWLINVTKLGADKQRLFVYNLRAFKTEERREQIYGYLNGLTDGNHLVILDGIRDVVTSPNDEKECNEVKDKLLEILGTHPNICLACVLHQNPSKELDGKMRGHLGTEILNKCGAEWVVSANRRDKDDALSPIVSYQATNSASRGESVSLPIVFSWDNGEVIPCAPPMPMEDTIKGQWDKVRVLIQDGIYSTAQMYKIIGDTCDVGSSSADKILKQFIKRGYLAKPKFGYYQSICNEVCNEVCNL